MNQLFKPTELNDARLGYFRSTNINQNVAPDLFANSIKPTELRYLKPVFGRAMYLDMITKRIAGEYLPDTANPAFPPVDMFPAIETAYNELFNNYVWGFFGKALTYQIQSTATIVITDAGTQAPEKLATLKDRQMRADTINKELSELRADMLTHLYENKLDFELWKPEGECANLVTQLFGCEGIIKPKPRIYIF